MSDLETANQATKEFIEKGLQIIFNDSLYWQKPIVYRTVGPYFPNVFDDFYNKQQMAIEHAKGELALVPIAEREATLRDLVGEYQDNNRIREHSRLTKYRKLNLHPPFWFLGGFGNDQCIADFKYWLQMPNYTIREAVFLSLGVEPDQMDEATLSRLCDCKDYSKMHPVVEYLVKRVKQFERKFVLDTFGSNYLTPERLKNWIDDVDLECHPDFYNLLDGLFPNPKSILTSRYKDTLDVREKTTLLQIIFVMAMDAYKFDPNTKRIPMAKEIEERAASNGIKMTRETIRKHLEACKELYNGEWNND